MRALLRKSAYPHAVSSIELIQTHISYVFLAEDQVYKLKKPVDLGFLDFSTLEKRRQACEAEIRLNQRGCPGGVYVGVEPLKQHHGSFRIGGEGETVDYLVHMKRLLLERMMDRMLERGDVDFEMIGRVAARLAERHRSAERGEKIAELGGFAEQVRNWRENLMQLHPWSAIRLAALVSSASRGGRWIHACGGGSAAATREGRLDTRLPR